MGTTGVVGVDVAAVASASMSARSHKSFTRKAVTRVTLRANSMVV